MFLEPFFIGSFGLIGLLASLALLIVGIIIIVVLAKVLFFLLPAAIVAVIVWLTTGGNEILAGIAFIAIAVISILKR